MAGMGADMAKAKFTLSLVILGTEVGALTEDAVAVVSGLDRAEEGAVVGIVIKDWIGVDLGRAAGAWDRVGIGATVTTLMSGITEVAVAVAAATVAGPCGLEVDFCPYLPRDLWNTQLLPQ